MGTWSGSILDPRGEWEQSGRVIETLPDGTELVSTDLGRLFEVATTT